MSTKKIEAGVAKNAPAGVALSDVDLERAHHEGAVEDAKKAGEAAHHALTDGSLPGEPPKNPYHGHDEIQQWAHILTLGVDPFVKAIGVGAADPSYIPDEKVYGLLALERNGQNRTPYVKTMMKRLDLKVEDLPGGGPSYTNDLTPISDL